MLVDNIKLTVKAGKGGDGAVTFKRNAQTAKGGPDGGNGGNGGSIYFRGSHNINDLSEFRFKKEIKADNGVSGMKKKLHGKNAKNKIIEVPLGTQIKEEESGIIYEMEDLEKLILIAQGGKGGLGNTEFKSATNQTPRFAETGTMGEKKELFLTLRLIADIGLIGLPNAGKSSLLTVLTRAAPKIGNYPFTTLEPNIGMFNNHPIADIPGLIEGASKGRGLGIAFLQHIEKTKVLLHCIDSTEEDLEKVYKTVRSEFKKYSEELLKKPEIILFTKTDLVKEGELRKKIKNFLKRNTRILFCSIYNEESIAKLKEEILIALD